MADEILKTCPKWIISNDEEMCQTFSASSDSRVYIIYTKNSKHNEGSIADELNLVPSVVPLPDYYDLIDKLVAPLPAKYYTGQEQLDVQLYKKFDGRGMKLVGTGKEIITSSIDDVINVINMPVCILHGTTRKKVDYFAGQEQLPYADEQACYIELWSLHERDNRKRLDLVQCTMILPTGVSEAVVRKLPNAEATTDMLYKAFPKELMDHFIDTLGSQKRVVARLDEKEPVKKSFLKRLLGK